MTCRPNFCIPVSFFESTHYKMKCLPGFFALWNLPGSPSLTRFVRLFPCIYNCSLRNFLVTNGVTQWIFNLNSGKSYFLISPAFIFIPYSISHSPKVSRPFCNYSIFLYIKQSSAKSLILKPMLCTLEKVVGPKRSLSAQLRLL
jgi:hypothetical protein